MTISVQTLAALALDAYNRQTNEGYRYETPVAEIGGFTLEGEQAASGDSNHFFASQYVNGATLSSSRTAGLIKD